MNTAITPYIPQVGVSCKSGCSHYLTLHGADSGLF